MPKKNSTKFEQPEDAPQPTREQLDLARQRIKHVIVLMLENRSFDHMLGYLEHPDKKFTPLQDGDHQNPFNLVGLTGPMTGVSRTAIPLLGVDPPHGHASAKTQMNGRNWKNFQMNGFVNAYARKLDGKEHIAKFHWNSITGLVLLFAIPLAAALYNISRRAVADGWSLDYLWFLIPSMVVVGVCLYSARHIPVLKPTGLLKPLAVASFLIAASAE
jgi:hypothetical protein